MRLPYPVTFTWFPLCPWINSRPITKSRAMYCFPSLSFSTNFAGFSELPRLDSTVNDFPHQISVSFSGSSLSQIQINHPSAVRTLLNSIICIYFSLTLNGLYNQTMAIMLLVNSGAILLP